MYGGLQNIFHFIHGTPYISLPQDIGQLHDFAKPEKDKSHCTKWWLDDLLESHLLYIYKIKKNRVVNMFIMQH